MGINFESKLKPRLEFAIDPLLVSFGSNDSTFLLGGCEISQETLKKSRIVIRNVLVIKKVVI